MTEVEHQMPNKSLIEILFFEHARDLKDVTGRQDDIFICPICLNHFTPNDICPEKLSDGHVWPNYIREKSRNQQEAPHRVLLCKLCNSMAGSRGDKQMQLRERIKDSEKNGEIYGERRVQVISKLGEPPINLRASSRIHTSDQINAHIEFQVNRQSGQWKRNNPDEKQRFLSINPEETFSLIIHPHHELKHDLAKTGWITSAYLFAFYTFGYRYIFQDSVNIIRQYIKNSLYDDVPKSLEFPTDLCGIRESNDNFYPDPEIGLIIPLDVQSFAHLQIGFLDYQIRLPFHFVPAILQPLISRKSDIQDELTNSLTDDIYLYSRIDCSKRDEHECIWDYVLGKPLMTS